MDTFLLFMLIIAVIYDLISRRIPNLLILSALAFAIPCHVYMEGYITGLIFSIEGFMIGMVLLIIPFIMGGMGAGDVKLLGAIGALKGSIFVFNTFLWMALWGGLIALAILIIRGRVKETMKKLGGKVPGIGPFLTQASGNFNELQENASSIYYPYALAIGLGVLSTYIRSWWW